MLPPVGHQPVGVGSLSFAAWTIDDHRTGRMYLPRSGERCWRQPQSHHCLRPIMVDAHRIIARSKAAVERRVDALAYPAFAAEESVANAHPAWLRVGAVHPFFLA